MSAEKLEQRGQSIVLIALLLVALIGLLGLVLDGGRVFGARRSSQNAADAAALAGVRIFASRLVTATESSVWDAIEFYAAENGVTNTTNVKASFINASGSNICLITQNCGGSIPSDATGVRVTTTVPVEPFFIDILIGDTPIPVPAVAAAQSGNPAVATKLAPMTLPFPCTYNPDDPDACSLQYGVSYALQGSSQLPGGFQWVDWTGGASANDIVNYLTMYWTGPAVMADPPDDYVPYSTPEPSPSPWIPSGPGVQPNGNIQIALDAWLDLSKWGLDHHLNWGPKPPDNKWIVPVFDVRYGTGNGAKYHVVMFALFQLQGYWFGNNQCNWIGRTGQSCNPNVGELPTVLGQCAALSDADPAAPPGSKAKCIMGQFLHEVKDFELYVGNCNTMGLDICAIGLSQ